MGISPPRRHSLERGSHATAHASPCPRPAVGIPCAGASVPLLATSAGATPGLLFLSVCGLISVVTLPCRHRNSELSALFARDVASPPPCHLAQRHGGPAGVRPHCSKGGPGGEQIHQNLFFCV